MADVRDWGAFIRSRWDWTRFGYEKGFPDGCQFSDIDAATEFQRAACGGRLVIEAKAYDGTGIIPSIYDAKDTGQRLLLRDEAKLGKAVLVVYGCGACNDPYAMHHLGPGRKADRFEDWRGYGKEERRKRLKHEIDRALGLGAPTKENGTS
jgi:hypothetical protein